MNWADLVPETVARDQNAWERRQVIVRMRQAKIRTDEIAHRLKMSRARVYQLYHEGISDRHQRSPVHVWCEETKDIEIIAEQARKITRDERLAIWRLRNRIILERGITITFDVARRATVG